MLPQTLMNVLKVQITVNIHVPTLLEFTPALVMLAIV